MTDQATVAADDLEISVSDYLHGMILDSNELEEFLNALARLAVHEISTEGEEVLCGVTLLRHKRAGTVASSSEAAQKLDEIQYDFGQGPCLTVSMTQEMVEIADLETDARWPAYARAVRNHGLRSVVAIPFYLEGLDRAALNLYSTIPGAFTSERVALAQDYARRASRALALSVRLAGHRAAEADATAALKSRTTIDLAVGMIMGQNRCSQKEAIELLKSASSSRNIKLRDIAARMTGSGTGEDAAATHFDR